MTDAHAALAAPHPGSRAGVRSSALEKLVEAAEVDRLRDRHLGYFVDWAEAASAVQREAHGLVADEIAEVRAGA